MDEEWSPEGSADLHNVTQRLVTGPGWDPRVGDGPRMSLNHGSNLQSSGALRMFLKVSKPLTSEIMMPTHIQACENEKETLEPPAPSLQKVGFSLLPNVTSAALVGGLYSLTPYPGRQKEGDKVLV